MGFQGAHRIYVCTVSHIRAKLENAMNPTACPSPRQGARGACVGASAVLALGAVTTAMHQEQTMTGGSNPVYSVAGGMTLATDVTTTIDEPTAMATSKAVPPVQGDTVRRLGVVISVGFAAPPSG